MLDKVIKWLLPPDEKFFTYLEKISQNLVDGAKTFAELKDSRGRVAFEDLTRRIGAIEEEGDELARVMHDALDKTFVTPMDREDLHSLTHALEETLDNLDGTVERFAIFGIDEPTPAMRKLIDLIGQAVVELARAVACLRDLRQIEAIQACVANVHRLEGEADQVYRQALADMFAGQDRLEPGVLVRNKDLLETLENAADMCHHAMTTIRAVVIKSL